MQVRPSLFFAIAVASSFGLDPATMALAQQADPFAVENAQPLPLLEPNQAAPNTPLSPVRANTRAQPAGAQLRVAPDGQLIPLANQPAAPVQGFRNTNADDPFAPLGLRMGRFTLLPEIAQSIGHTSSESADGDEGTFSQTDIRLRFESDFSRHAVTGELGGSIQKFLDGDEDTISLADGQVEYRHDLRQTTTLRLGLGFNHVGELGSGSIIDDPLSTSTLDVTEEGAQTTVNGFAEVNHDAGTNALLLRGAFERTVLGDATLVDGSSFDQSDQNSTLVTATGRLTFNSAAVTKPFVEATLGQRIFKNTFDRNGVARNSTLASLRAGIVVERGDKLNGELAVGYGFEDLQDRAMDDLKGFTIDGTINWSPLRETLVSATASTLFDTASDPADSGVISHTVGLAITRDLRPNWTLNGQINASLRRFEGSGRKERILQLQTGSEWQMNRNAALFATLGHEIIESDDGFSDDAATTVRLGIRVRR